MLRPSARRNLCLLGALLGLCGCAAPQRSAPPPQSAAPSPAPSRAPARPDASFLGMVNAIQIKHVQTTLFPRLSPRELEDLRRINRGVNHAICYLPDQEHYGVPDRAVSFPDMGGSPVFAVSAPRYGDCEDYALTKKDRLVAQGWDPKRLVVALASVPDHGGMVRHAVLAVPDGDEWLVLCNHHDAIDRASSLEQRWGWRFVWPHYGTYRENFAAAEPDDETETL